MKNVSDANRWPIISEKMLQQIKSIFWEKWVWSLKTLNPTSHVK